MAESHLVDQVKVERPSTPVSPVLQENATPVTMDYDIDIKHENTEEHLLESVFMSVGLTSAASYISAALLPNSIDCPKNQSPVLQNGSQSSTAANVSTSQDDISSAQLSPVLCSYCGELFNDQQKLQNHMASVHAKDTGILLCKICGKDFDGPHADLCMEIHMLLSHGMKTYQCILCHFSSYETTEIIKHFSKDHSNRGVLTLLKLLSYIVRPLCECYIRSFSQFINTPNAGSLCGNSSIDPINQPSQTPTTDAAVPLRSLPSSDIPLVPSAESSVGLRLMNQIFPQNDASPVASVSCIKQVPAVTNSVLSQTSVMRQQLSYPATSQAVVRPQRVGTVSSPPIQRPKIVSNSFILSNLSAGIRVPDDNINASVLTNLQSVMLLPTSNNRKQAVLTKQFLKSNSLMVLKTPYAGITGSMPVLCGAGLQNIVVPAPVASNCQAVIGTGTSSQPNALSSSNSINSCTASSNQNNTVDVVPVSSSLGKCKAVPSQSVPACNKGAKLSTEKIKVPGNVDMLMVDGKCVFKIKYSMGRDTLKCLPFTPSGTCATNSKPVGGVNSLKRPRENQDGDKLAKQLCSDGGIHSIPDSTRLKKEQLLRDNNLPQGERLSSSNGATSSQEIGAASTSGSSPRYPRSSQPTIQPVASPPTNLSKENRSSMMKVGSIDLPILSRESGHLGKQNNAPGQLSEKAHDQGTGAPWQHSKPIFELPEKEIKTDLLDSAVKDIHVDNNFPNQTVAYQKQLGKPRTFDQIHKDLYDFLASKHGKGYKVKAHFKIDADCNQVLADCRKVTKNCSLKSKLSLYYPNCWLVLSSFRHKTETKIRSRNTPLFSVLGSCKWPTCPLQVKFVKMKTVENEECLYLLEKKAELKFHPQAFKHLTIDAKKKPAQDVIQCGASTVHDNKIKKVPIEVLNSIKEVVPKPENLKKKAQSLKATKKHDSNTDKDLKITIDTFPDTDFESYYAWLSEL